MDDSFEGWLKEQRHLANERIKEFQDQRDGIYEGVARYTREECNGEIDYQMGRATAFFQILNMKSLWKKDAPKKTV